MDRTDVKLAFLLAYLLAIALHSRMAHAIYGRGPARLEVQIFAGANVALAAWHVTQLVELMVHGGLITLSDRYVRALVGSQLLLGTLVLVLFFHLFATFERIYRRRAPSLRAAITSLFHRKEKIFVPAAYLVWIAGGIAYSFDAGQETSSLVALRETIGPTSAYLFGGTLLFMTFVLFPARAGQEKILVPALGRAMLLVSLSVTVAMIAFWHDDHPTRTQLVLLPYLHLHSVAFCIFLALVRYEFSFLDRYVRDGLRFAVWSAVVVASYFAFNRTVFRDPDWGRYATSIGRIGVLLLAVSVGPWAGRHVARWCDRVLFAREMDFNLAIEAFGRRLARTRQLRPLLDASTRDIARFVHAKKVHIVVGRSSQTRRTMEREQQDGFRLRVPMMVGNSAAGWILLGERRNLYPYFDGERQFLHKVGRMLGEAIEAMRATRDGHRVEGSSSRAETSADNASRVRIAELERELAVYRERAQSLRERFDPELLGDLLDLAEEIGVRDPAGAIQVLQRLRSAYDYVLSEDTTTTLGREMGFAQDYLALEKLRLRNRLDVTLRYDTALEDQLLPRRILQPLIENALGHGLARELRKGRVEIRCTAEESTCQIVVEDNGRGFRGSADDALQGEGGLGRVRQALRARFGEASSLRIEEPAATGTLVVVRVPMRDAGGQKRNAADSA